MLRASAAELSVAVDGPAEEQACWCCERMDGWVDVFVCVYLISLHVMQNIKSKIDAYEMKQTITLPF